MILRLLFFIALCAVRPAAAQAPSLPSYEQVRAAFERGDYSAAFRGARQRSEWDDKRVHYFLGRMFREGWGTDPDKQQAYSYYLSAADQGDVRGTHGLGEMYWHGELVARNPERACDYFAQAASRSLASAQRDFARCELTGQGRPRDLAAGTYFLEASKVGFFPVQQSATVEAGVERPDIVKFQLVPDLANQPLVSSFQYDGFLQCSFTLVLVGFNACGVPEIFGMPLDNPLVVHDIAPNGTFAQTEMVWKSTQSLGDQLDLQYSWGTCGTLYCDHGDTGTSPLIISADEELLTTMLNDPANPGNPGLMIRVFGTEASAAEGLGLGATLDQSFTHYTHVFYAFLPNEGWTFIEDGSHPLPA